MCDHIVQTCSASAKPLLYVGSFALWSASMAAFVYSFHINSIQQTLEPPSAGYGALLARYGQYAAFFFTSFLGLSTGLSTHRGLKAFNYVLAVAATVVCVLAAGSVFMVPSPAALEERYASRINNSVPLYNFTDPAPPAPQAFVNPALPAGNRSKRFDAVESAPATEPPMKEPAPPPLTAATATELLDRLQTVGCCGFRNATLEWPAAKLPRTCCDNPVSRNGERFCEKLDSFHSTGCLYMVSHSSAPIYWLLILIALGCLLIALVTCVDTFRTCKYDEASQNAYT